jgi:hypothetical protein
MGDESADEVSEEEPSRTALSGRDPEGGAGGDEDEDAAAIAAAASAAEAR